jgi:hypothetical protein
MVAEGEESEIRWGILRDNSVYKSDAGIRLAAMSSCFSGWAMEDFENLTVKNFVNVTIYLQHNNN